MEGEGHAALLDCPISWEEAVLGVEGVCQRAGVRFHVLFLHRGLFQAGNIHLLGDGSRAEFPEFCHEAE